MVICKEIDYYLKYAEEHPKWINKKRKLLIENIVKPTLKRNDVFFDEKTYRNCLQYCKTNYYELFPFQKFIYAFAFMYVDDIPVFSKFFIKEGRGNGKDGFIVPLVNFFQTPLYGVKNYHVEIVANSESQVKDTFKVAYDMLHDNPKFKGKFSVTKELITNLATGSEMKYNTSNAKTKDGKRTGCLVLNEIHAYENYDQINVFESSFGKVKHSREFIITTDGYVRDGPLDEISAMCAEILETGENLLGYFPFICEIDDMKEVDDPEAWHKANPSMEYMPILANQIMHDYLEMKKIPSKRAEFITKRMDRSARKEEETVTTWQNVLRACYEGETMEELERKIPRITLDTRGQAAVIGIDYADVRDFASAGILTKTDDGEWIWRQHTWICADSPFIDSIKFPLRNVGQEEFEDFEVVQGPVIDVNIIADWCMKQFQDYDVKKIAMDTYRYTLFKTAFEERGLTIEDKKNPHGIVRLVRKITSATGIIAGCVLVVAAIAPILSGIGNIAMGIQTLIPLISNLWTVLGPMGIVVIIGLIILLYNKCEWFRNGVNAIFGGIADFIKGVINKIKGFFNFEWKLPKIKLPHFKASGEWSLVPPKVPKFSVDWYANGGILNSPTIFGMNGDRAMGGGEAGAEAVLPIELLKTYIRDEMQANNYALAQLIAEALSEMSLVIENQIQLGDKKLADVLVDAIIKKMSQNIKWKKGAAGV